MGEALHSVLGSLHHTGVVELVMLMLCLANSAISPLCTNACPPEAPLTMARFQWKDVLPQSHEFVFYSSITSTLWLCRTTKPKNFHWRPYCFLIGMSTDFDWYEYRFCNLKYLLIHGSFLPLLASCTEQHAAKTQICMRAGAVPTIPVAQESLPLSFSDQSYHRYLVSTEVFSIQLFFFYGLKSIVSLTIK